MIWFDSEIFRCNKWTFYFTNAVQYINVFKTFYADRKWLILLTKIFVFDSLQYINEPNIFKAKQCNISYQILESFYNTSALFRYLGRRDKLL